MSFRVLPYLEGRFWDATRGPRQVARLVLRSVADLVFRVTAQSANGSAPSRVRLASRPTRNPDWIAPFTTTSPPSEPGSSRYESVQLLFATLPAPAIVEGPTSLSSRADAADGSLLEPFEKCSVHARVSPAPPPRSEVAAVTLAHPRATPRDHPSDHADSGTLRRVGPWWLREDAAEGRILRLPWSEPQRVLADLPPLQGPPTVLFLLPHLAVGGAERLLDDLVRGLGQDVRSVFVTLEPHRHDLGETLSRARGSSEHLFLLGDWLPREAHLSALLHLLRRYDAKSIVSWNGTVFFYDQVDSIRQSFPNLRIVHQVFSDRGGWMARTGPRTLRAADVHLAVNHATARAFGERGATGTSVRLVHHGVPLPDLPEPEARRNRQRAARKRLGLPEGNHGDLWAGAFLRLHPQKRPLDLVELADRVRDTPWRLLIAGGGPLEGEMDRRIAEIGGDRIVRLPFQSDIDTLYDAVDCCLSPSSYEGLPVLLLDAAARALPLVATSVGDIPLLLSGGGGISIERPGDLEAFSRGLRALTDADTRAAIGNRARQTVEERFSVERFVEEMREVLFP